MRVRLKQKISASYRLSRLFSTVIFIFIFILMFNSMEINAAPSDASEVEENPKEYIGPKNDIQYEKEFSFSVLNELFEGSGAISRDSNLKTIDGKRILEGVDLYEFAVQNRVRVRDALKYFADYQSLDKLPKTINHKYSRFITMLVLLHELETNSVNSRALESLFQKIAKSYLQKQMQKEIAGVLENMNSGNVKYSENLVREVVYNKGGIVAKSPDSLVDNVVQSDVVKSIGNAYLAYLTIVDKSLSKERLINIDRQVNSALRSYVKKMSRYFYDEKDKKPSERLPEFQVTGRAGRNFYLTNQLTLLALQTTALIYFIPSGSLWWAIPANLGFFMYKALDNLRFTQMYLDYIYIGKKRDDFVKKATSTTKVLSRLLLEESKKYAEKFQSQIFSPSKYGLSCVWLF